MENVPVGVEVLALLNVEVMVAPVLVLILVLIAVGKTVPKHVLIRAMILVMLIAEGVVRLERIVLILVFLTVLMDVVETVRDL